MHVCTKLGLMNRLLKDISHNKAKQYPAAVVGDSTTNTPVGEFPVSNGRRLKTCHAVPQTNVELGKSVNRM
jgi:hypothetical protein